MNKTPHRTKSLKTRRGICLRRQRESGQAIFVVALTMVVLLVAAGFAVDMGYLRYQRRLEQTAADSAAIAGATQISACAGSPGCQALVNEAQTSSSYNGFTNNPPQTTVTVNNPPASGPHLGNSSYVETIITENVPTFFAKVLGTSFSSFPVAARAVAYPGPGPSCIYGLNGISFTGLNTAVYAPSCTLTDSGNLCILSSSYILHTLGNVYGLSTLCPQPGPGQIDPSPVQGAPAGNPLPYLSGNTPSVGAGSSPCGSYTYCAGSYRMGINIVGTSTNMVYSFQPGTYVLGGSGLTISGYGQVTGSGVTFYTNGTGAFSINSGTDYGNMNCALNPPNLGMTVRLSAPTDPANPYAGILLIQDDSASSTTPPSTIVLNNADTCNAPTLNTNSTSQQALATSSYLWGVLYFPSGLLTLNGTGLDEDNACAWVPRFTIVVAFTLVPEGNLNFGTNDCVSPLTPYTFPTPLLPDPIKDAVLVE